MKSGNVIELSNLLSLNWEIKNGVKKLSWQHHPDENTFNLLGGNTLDIESIEAITHRVQKGSELIR